MNNRTPLLTAALIVLGTSGICADATRFNPNPVIPRRIGIKSESAIPLASGGKAQCEVVIPEKSSPMLRYAGSQLAFYLEKIIGGKVAVTAKPSGKKTAFILGPSGAKLAGFDLKKLDRDGYIIKTIGNKIAIAGNDDARGNPQKNIPQWNERGTLNGVYEFLERFGGVRFYFPGEIGTVVPRKADWKLPEIDIVDRPDNTYRQAYYGHGALGKKTVFYRGTPVREIRMGHLFQTRMSTLNLPNCHGLAYLGLVERFAKTHPEYFALRDNGERINGVNPKNEHEIRGQLCYSNDELKNEIYLDAKAFLSGQSAASRGIVMPDGKSYWVHSRHSLPFFNIMPGDGMYPCHCPKCWPVFSTKDRQKSSDLIWKFKTDIARKLKQEGIPGYTTMMAYAAYTKIPNVDIPDNVIVQLAQTGPWNESNPAGQAQSLQLMKDWKKKLNGKTYLWTYICKSGSRPVMYIPAFTPRAVGSFFKKAAPEIFGCFLESEAEYWIANFMNYYVFGKVMWDVTTDVDALMEEHFRLMYGPAAAEMKEFYDTLERHWMKDIVGKIVDTPVGLQPVFPTYFELWAKIYNPTEIERVNQLFDLAEKKAAGDPDALKRVKFMRRELWGPVLEGAGEFNRSANNRKLWTIHVPEAGKITVDGKLDEESWKKAETVWLRPAKDKPAEVQTRVRMLADRDNYYVGIECDEPFTDKMVCVKRKKDDVELWRDNVTEIFFSSGRQALFRYQIMLSSLGDTCDLRAENRHEDLGWDSGMEYRHSVVPGKMWVAEIRIPRKSMPELKGNEFSVNFTRSRILKAGCQVKNLYYSWFPRGLGGHTPENFGSAVLGEPEKSKSVVLCGDFDGRVAKTRMYQGKTAVWHSDAPFPADRQFFMTKGQAVRLELPGGGRVLRQFFAKGLLKAGVKYRLSFYLKTENVVNSKNTRLGAYMDIRFGKKNALGNALFPLSPTLFGSMDWTRFQFEFTVPEGVGEEKSPYIGFYLPKEAEGKVWIDHVEIVPL